MLRVYGPRDTRQDRAVRSVASEDELHAVLNQITLKSDGREAGVVINITRSFTFTRPVTISASGVAIRSNAFLPLTVDMDDSLSFVFKVDALPFSMEGLYLKSASESGLELVTVYYTIASTLFESMVTIRNCRFYNFVTPIIISPGGNPSFVDVSHNAFGIDNATPFTAIYLANAIGTVVGNAPMELATGNIWRIQADGTTNRLNIVGNDTGGGNVTVNGDHVALVGNDLAGGSISCAGSNGGVGGYVVVANDLGGGAISSSSADSLSEGNIGVAADAATLLGAGPTLTVRNQTYIRLTFDAGSSGNITLGDGGYHGQRLTLFCVSYAGSATLPDATAQNVKLSAAWTPTADDTISLIWDATDGNWIETGRSAN